MQMCKYFAFGSNLLQKRLHLSCPEAKRLGPGLLKNYRLDFDFLSKRWGGYVATILEDESSEVWGAIWELPESSIPNLDKQEGVQDKVYKPLSIHVTTPSGEDVSCRSYQLCSPSISKDERYKNKPSRIYLDTMIKGAIESCLPDEYIEEMKRIPHNGFSGPVQFDLN